MYEYKKFFTIKVEHRLVNNVNVIQDSTTRTFIGYYEQIADWIDTYFIYDLRSLDFSKDGYVSTEVNITLNLVDAIGTAYKTKRTTFRLKDEYHKSTFLSCRSIKDREITDKVKLRIKDLYFSN